jgi:hypothetical protein
MHSGALALARRLRRIPDPQKRRVILREYARVLVELEAEIIPEEQSARLGHNGGPALEEAPRPLAAAARGAASR